VMVPVVIVTSVTNSALTMGVATSPTTTTLINPIDPRIDRTDISEAVLPALTAETEFSTSLLQEHTLIVKRPPMAQGIKSSFNHLCSLPLSSLKYSTGQRRDFSLSWYVKDWSFAVYCSKPSPQC
ncbi:MAG: hypothetical protein Q9167_006124, partial [Letrouitia subvulpina]